ncbi:MULTISPECIES: type I phosphomannose isomerase catalytic subunit [Flavobacteriaceae]|uniref:Phosphohexomutase n=2 Tax=Flavobacteriaceae TaxID=49546 RepID=A0A4Y8AWP2_9FLAO|nr:MULTISPECIES: type I phosphomannose isomerase catalytic subunit [Flavobacteriaceae]TEW76911.1 mannose-6-phosphate isomerase [Gramella jeungdoensis]GGK59373.1 mannose-6-phosphate isomerase [Lutibacter litoralis]
MLNYPIKFQPILKDKIWGGDKLVNNLNKKSNLKDIGESWEISDVEGDVSVVENGPLKGRSLKELLETYKGDLLGKNNFANFGTNFPLLIKFIDAKQDLSVQVHPNDELSKMRHNSFGKTEMWYIMQADEGSRLILGFNKTIKAEDYVKLLEEKKIMSVLNDVPVEKGDAFFIETGTVHAIGAGIVLAEIQQTSDITYRIYDFDRVDDAGNERELHTELAIDALNFSDKIDTERNYSSTKNSLNEVVKCEYFKTNFIPVEGALELDYSATDSFVIFMCVEGNATISVEGTTETINFGETILIPATAKNVIIKGDCNLLEVTV